MKSLINTVSSWSVSTLGNGLLIATGSAVALCGVALLALYMVNHIQETPGMIRVRCMVQPSYEACPQHDAAIERLNGQLEAARREREALERQLAGLRAIQNSVDRITLFESHQDPDSGYGVMVGTVYRELVNAAPEPESYFCYIQLPNGPSGEDRLQDVRADGQMVQFSASMRRTLGIGASTLAFATEVCKPKLVTGG